MLQGIYKITNKKNRKIYIGSSDNVAKRWTQHISSLLDHSHHNEDMLGDFINYGEDITIFQFEILELCECSKEKLLEKESKYIVKNRAMSNKGYNKSLPKKVKKEIEKKTLSCDMDDFDSFLKNIDKDILLKLKNNINIYGLEDQTKFKNEKYNYIYKRTFLSQNSLHNEEEIQDLIKKACANFLENSLEYNIKSSELYWTTYAKCKEDIQRKGFIKGFLSLNAFTPKKNRRKHGMYVANPFLNTWVLDKDIRPSKEKEDLYKVSKVIEWIINNLNIEEEFYLFIPCPYVRKLVEEYIRDL